MEAVAKVKYLRMSPRKFKIVLDIIRHKSVKEAMAILKHTPRLACEQVIKLLKSAVANGENNFNMDPSDMYISECYATPGPTLKRARPVSKGRSYRILKRTSHLTIKVKEYSNKGGKS